MFKEERQKEILSIIKDSQSVSVKELSNQFNVSILTVRRDLDALFDKNLIQRTHGGAIAKESSILKEIYFNEKDGINVVEKDRIAKVAIKFINSTDTVFIDGGTTTIRVARELKNLKSIKVITNSIKIAIELSENDNVILLGGNVRFKSFNTVGALVLRELDNFYADKLILAIDGIDFNNGLTTTELSESVIKNKMINRAKETMVVADSSKIGKVGPFKVAPLTSVKRIITDSNLSNEYIKNFETVGVELIIS